MFSNGPNPSVARSSWAAPLAICCVLLLLLLVAATIVIALIPIYLSRKNVTVPNPNAYTFNTLYASNVNNGQSLTLSDTSGLSNQLNSGIPGAQNTLDLESGQFLLASAASKRKRQTSFGTVTCEQATGLSGDIFSAKNILNIPGTYNSAASQSKYLTKYQNYIRDKNRRKTVTMVFTTETLVVTLAFCGFTAAVPINSGNSTNSTVQCTSNAATYIYLLDQLGEFYYFNPVNYDTYYVGTINCTNNNDPYSTVSDNAFSPINIDPYSLAIQSDGTAWVLFSDGNLYKFNIQNGQCMNTSYLYGQYQITLFGMNFINDTSTNTEKLYLTTDSSTPPFQLATLDTGTLEITIVRYYDNIVGRGELAGTSDGRLFGLFEGTPFIVAEINKTSADIISKTPQNSIQYVSDSSYFAIASYQSNFFLFAGNDSSSTDIYLYNSTSQTATKIKTVPIAIIGASSSICINGFTLN